MRDNRLTVLLVEDEPHLRMTEADLLEDAGNRVIATASAGEALRWLEANRDAVDVLVTDVHMPGAMDGLGLAREVDSLWPRIRLVVTSGFARYSDADIPDHGRFLAKPWGAGARAQAIERARR